MIIEAILLPGSNPCSVISGKRAHGTAPQITSTGRQRVWYWFCGLNIQFFYVADCLSAPYPGIDDEPKKRNTGKMPVLRPHRSYIAGLSLL
jgi:hypothetical protein